jgi:hypothetical protein
MSTIICNGGGNASGQLRCPIDFSLQRRQLAHDVKIVAKEQPVRARREKFAELGIFLVRRQKFLVVPELDALDLLKRQPDDGFFIHGQRMAAQAYAADCQRWKPAKLIKILF